MLYDALRLAGMLAFLVWLAREPSHERRAWWRRP